jgi:hypothetical protein
MKQSLLERTICRWLRLLKIPASRTLLTEKLTTHADYPSLFSITDTLLRLGIACSAMVVDKGKASQINFPVLLFSENNRGEFVLVRDLQRYFEKRPVLLETWNGIIVVAQMGTLEANIENRRRYIEDRRRSIVMGVFMACLLVLPLCLLWNRLSAYTLLLWTADLTGLGVASIIVMKKFGYSNRVTDQLCNFGGHVDCSAIIDSRRAKLNRWLDWSDIGVIYFAAVCILQIQGIEVGMVSLFAFPFTLFSLYYQWRIMRKWCTLCLFVVMLLWVTEGLSLPGLIHTGIGQVRIASLTIVASVFLLLAGAWLIFIKPFLSDYSKLREGALVLTRFKRDPNVFISLLERGRSVDTTRFEQDLQLGNQAARLQLLVICQPYCAPCAKAHLKLNEILSTHGDSIGVTIRFLLNAEHQNDNRARAVRYILELWLEKSENLSRTEKAVFARQLLDNWFEHMNYELFAKNNVVTGSRNADALSSRHGQWCIANQIRATPTIFLQGKELPPQYDLNELNHFIPNVLEVIAQPGSHPQIA